VEIADEFKFMVVGVENMLDLAAW
jgi:hypothetical protein